MYNNDYKQSRDGCRTDSIARQNLENNAGLTRTGAVYDTRIEKHDATFETQRLDRYIFRPW
ncbi:MAG: hypothetical protein SCM11_16455, partial [Bacillota bacterium]|nr:hypothetical protein [Bacillota bacterium]